MPEPAVLNPFFNKQYKDKIMSKILLFLWRLRCEKEEGEAGSPGLKVNISLAACGSSGRNHGEADVSVQRTTAEQILTLQPMKDPMPEQEDIS